ncbi:benzoate/H(+) symporter BenE family transporter [Ammoniphilus sp. CFH 90114]|uniref:benzoate/H(+) symporter BenE family transporter n=1 Tax=Ammoniphilus sp. CFH 90114 TaxID=2493665 RepID=UPI00196B6313|nr:benzoate/H(+) symporter BenE family transporter [Ammoniphilus sp. CFH 90114]
MSDNKERIIETGPGIMSGLRDLPKHLNTKSVTAGTLAAIFGCTGPALIVMGAAEKGGFTPEQTISWLFSIYFFGGLFSIIMALRFKTPINGAYSIPGAVLMATALLTFNIHEASGAYMMAGILVFILGISGTIGKIMKWIPLPIIMGMIAGAMFRFALSIVDSIQAAPFIAGATVISFLIFYRLWKRFPPILGALGVGVLVAWITGQIQVQSMDIGLALPQFVAPVFTLDAFLSIALPLAVLVIGAENAQATGVLLSQGYRAPVNYMTTISGIGGMVTSLFGGHNANIAGPMTALCSSELAGDKKEGRYAATVVDGVLFAGFGLIAGIAVPVLLALPRTLISTVAGLAMLAVLISVFQGAFSGKKFQFGAFAAFVVAMSGITIFKISAPFWALIIGVAVSYIVEQNHFSLKKNDAPLENEDKIVVNH